MKQALALCAIVAVSSAEPQWLTNWKEYEPAKHQYRHHERVHRRGFAAQDKMKTKMVAAGYPVSAKHAEEMEKHRQRQLKNGHVLQQKRTSAEADYFQYQLGIAAGLQYSSRSEGPCVQTIQANIYGQVYIFDEILMQIYKPAKWAELWLDLTSMIDIQSQQIEACNYNEMLNNLGQVLTYEGASTLGSRLLGSLAGEATRILDGILGNKDDKYKQGYWIGKAFSLVTNWHTR